MDKETKNHIDVARIEKNEHLIWEKEQLNENLKIRKGKIDYIPVSIR